MGKDDRRDPDASDVLELNSDNGIEDEAEGVVNGEDATPDPDERSDQEVAAPVSDGESDTEVSEDASSPDSESRMEVARLETQIQQLKEENRNLKDSLLRKMAEFENLKKRTAREKDEAVRYGTAGILTSLLDVLDNFDRALATEPTIEDHHSFYEGMKLIAKHLFDVLKSEGLVEINPKEEAFDPFFHEAMMRKESTAFPENTVLEVFQKGYKLRDRLLRPARVMVSTRPAGEERDEPGSESDAGKTPVEEPEAAGVPDGAVDEPEMADPGGEDAESETEQTGSAGEEGDA